MPDWPDPDVGELVYAGSNVMLGYAESAADLRLGRTVDELPTGDLARRTADGLFEIVGRRSRIAKVFGLRIDLDDVEASLERDGVTACCLARDDRLAVVVESGRGDPGRVRLLAARACRLPGTCGSRVSTRGTAATGQRQARLPGVARPDPRG